MFGAGEWGAEGVTQGKPIRAVCTESVLDEPATCCRIAVDQGT